VGFKGRMVGGQEGDAVGGWVGERGLSSPFLDELCGSGYEVR
jgi:hypothetical protein